MRKVGAQKKTDMKEMVAAALVGAIPVLEPVDMNSLRGHESSIVRSGLAETIVTYVFSGLSNVAIGKRTGVGVDTVDRFLRTPYFQALYASKREMLLSGVEEMQRERIQEILMQAVEKKYTIMMDEHTSRGLADKIATDFIQMGERMLKMGKGRTSDALAAIFEQTLKQRGKNGQETTSTVRVSGTVEEIAAATRGFQVSNVAGSGGEGVAPHEEDGAENRTERDTQDAGRALAPWDRPADGGSGPEPGSAPTGPTVAGDVAPPGGAGEGGR